MTSTESKIGEPIKISIEALLSTNANQSFAFCLTLTKLLVTCKPQRLIEKSVGKLYLALTSSYSYVIF